MIDLQGAIMLDILRKLDPRCRPLILLWIIAGILWVIGVYSDYPPGIRMVCVFIMVGLAFWIGIRSHGTGTNT